jgi:hypothetical protein
MRKKLGFVVVITYQEDQQPGSTFGSQSHTFVSSIGETVMVENATNQLCIIALRQNQLRVFSDFVLLLKFRQNKNEVKT